MVALALLLRVGFMLTLQSYDFPTMGVPGPTNHFSFGYETGAIAASLASGHGYASPFGGQTGPTAWIAPLYPALCALVFRLFGVFSTTSAIVILTLNSIFAALNCIPLCRIGERTLGRAAGLCAGWVWAAGVIFIRWPITWVWEVSLSALLVSVLLLQSLKLADDENGRNWLWFGFLWGFAALTNPSLLGVLPPLLLWPAVQLHKRGAKPARLVLVALFAFLVTISPWLVRNRVTFGKWVFIRSNAAFEFSMGNYQGSHGLGWFGKHPTQNSLEYDRYAQMGELAYIAKYQHAAFAFVRAHPREFLQITAKRFWAVWYGTWFNYVNEDLEPFRTWMYWPLALLAGLGLIAIVARGEPAAWLLTAAVLLYPLPYYLAFAQPRYRHAIEPEMLLVASYFVMELASDLRARFQRKTVATKTDVIGGRMDQPFEPTVTSVTRG